MSVGGLLVAEGSSVAVGAWVALGSSVGTAVGGTALGLIGLLTCEVASAVTSLLFESPWTTGTMTRSKLSTGKFETSVDV